MKKGDGFRGRVYKCASPPCEHYNVRIPVEAIWLGSPAVLYSWPSNVRCAACDRPAWHVTPDAEDPPMNWHWEQTDGGYVDD